MLSEQSKPAQVPTSPKPDSQKPQPQKPAPPKGRVLKEGQVPSGEKR